MSSPYDQPQPVLGAITDRGEKIMLRAAEMRDVDAILTACTDPESQRWTTLTPGYDRDRAIGFITGYAPGWWAGAKGAAWVIADADGAYAGQIDLRVLADPQIADVGFLTGPAARGKGYMTAALRTAAAYGLLHLGLERVEWKAHVGNVASRRVAEKAGFTFEGTLRAYGSKDGRRVDEWIASLLPADLADGTTVEVLA
ncbi:GNAT family protein [Hamadaea sp. NPDC050747]|uniref:GNAT family N-acetyltransferase n=1 Tax=Hamadaea sp. NPDC050747 TaxID=3155789 RepID=UPI00340D374A